MDILPQTRMDFMPEEYCAVCKTRNTCKVTCPKVKKLLRSVANSRTINEEVPEDFIYQLFINPRVWPSPQEETSKKKKGKL